MNVSNRTTFQHSAQERVQARIHYKFLENEFKILFSFAHFFSRPFLIY